MKRFTFGTPEKLVPSAFCPGFHYVETEISYPADNFTFKRIPSGCVLEFPLEDDCHIYGFGLQLKQFDHRGRKLRLEVNADPVAADGESHAPVPFFVTNKGYGMYFDTARYAEFYCGKQKNTGKRTTHSRGGTADSEAELYAVRPDTDLVMSVRIPTAAGVDVYVIEGENITEIVSQYNLLSGGGPKVPEWGLGMMYRCYTRWGADQILSLAERFKANGISCSILGLEPGWHTHAYSCTYKWSEAYPDPDGFIAHLRKLGYHINLWEHAFVHPDASIHEALVPYSGDWLVWGGLVPDFATPQGRKIFADYHRKELVDHGIDGFKLDECDSSDFTGGWSFPLSSEFPSGLDGEQYHALFGTLYAQTLLEALDGTETLSEIRQLGALAAPYPFVLYSDLYDHRDFIRGIVNAGFSGLLWTPEFRRAQSREECIRRIQCTVFSCQFQIDSWNYDGVPWEIFDCEEEVRELILLRKKLIPMLKKSFNLYHETGKPPIRALVMDFTQDEATYAVDDEYLFCEDLLVAPITADMQNRRRVYLPRAARWADFYTGKEILSPKDGMVEVETARIPVYRRIG